MRLRGRGMTEHQVRARLYDPPASVRRLDAKLGCLRLSAGPRIRGEDLRQAFATRLDGRSPEPANDPARGRKGPRIRLIA